MTATGLRPAVIVHGALDASRPDERDTLQQVDEIAGALQRLGHQVEIVALGLDLSPLARVPRSALVFNMVEAIGGDGRLLHLPAAVMEHFNLTFTGSPAMALALTTDKVLTKRALAACGLAVPETIEAGSPTRKGERYIVKPLAEDASFGLDADSVVAAEDVAAEIARRAKRFGGRWFAERYIEGREINVSIVEDGDGLPKVLPPAEIEFVGYAPDRPRIVDYEAKWLEESHAYANTPRRFIDRTAEAALIDELEHACMVAWRTLGLAGYARVDFRVDAAGKCYILEANANPCLARDTGFAAAVTEAGLEFDDAIRLIAAAAERRSAMLK